MYDESQKQSLMDRLGSPAQPVSPIESAFAGLQREINVLEESVNSLLSRTSKVSTPPPPPMPCKETAGHATGPHSATWHSINEASHRITTISADIRELTSRLET